MKIKFKDKCRTYLDPIHGPIKLYFDDPVDNLLIQIIDSKEFQRLRRIKQMGTGWYVFHGAEHTRFGHSIGAMHIASKIINHLSRKQFEINKHELQILTTALLHDIGHGPFSHTGELLSGINHEEWTKYLISCDSGLNKLLKGFDKKLPDSIIKTMDYTDLPLYASQIISSYIDCDRLDYLHRDSYYVGVPYGITGSDRIISSLEIDLKSEKLVVRESTGLDSVIHYLHARYSMYQQIYQHKKNLAADFLLQQIAKRIKLINPSNTPKPLYDWLNSENKKIDSIDIESFLLVDDYLMISSIHQFANFSSDKILKDLCYRFIYRKLFKSLEFRPQIKKEKIKNVFEKVKNICLKKRIDPEFYTGIKESSSKPYEPYDISKSKTGKAVFIKQKGGEIKELSKISGLVKALSQENVVKTCLVFAPEIEEDVYKIKGFSELFK